MKEHVFIQKCAKCGEPASTVKVRIPEPGEHQEPTYDYSGPGGSGPNNDASQERAQRLIRMFTPPCNFEAIEEEFYDNAGLCTECGKFYCHSCWGGGEYGTCPKKHGKSLDPHWSPY